MTRCSVSLYWPTIRVAYIRERELYFFRNERLSAAVTKTASLELVDDAMSLVKISQP
jgi:hypothetical protein